MSILNLVLLGQQLYLAGNQITSLASLPQLPNLEVIYRNGQSLIFILYGNKQTFAVHKCPDFFRLFSFLFLC